MNQLSESQTALFFPQFSLELPRPRHQLRSTDRELLQQNGVRVGDQVQLTPIQGRPRSLNLLRTRHFFLSPERLAEVKKELSSAVITIDSFGGERFELVLELVHTAKRGGVEDDLRYHLRALNGQSFRINGVLTCEAHLFRGDRVNVGHNILAFFPPNPLAQEMPSEFITPAILESDISVLLMGETGTGKSQLARKIYNLGQYLGPFIHLNLSALSPQLLESELFGHQKGSFTGAITDKVGALLEANDGVLFLDEIDSLPLEIQTKLLLFLDNREVRRVGGSGSRKSRARLIFASGSELEKLVESGKMRRDFYFRLTAGLTLQLPPLRLAPEKIRYFCQQFSSTEDVVMNPELLDFYQTLPWPGNFRQLSSHLMKKKFLTSGRRWELDALDWDLAQKDHAFPTHFFEQQMGAVVSLKEMKERYTHWVYQRLGKSLTWTSYYLKMNTHTCRKLLNLRGAEEN